MRNNTRRALRATATVAGVAALAGTYAGTAFADSDLPGLGGDHSFGGSDSDGGFSGLGSSDGSTIFDEPGLGNFEMPGMGMGSRGFRTSSPSDFGDFGNFGDNENDSDSRGDGDHCSHSSHSNSRDSDHGFQNPMQCSHDNYFKHDDFNILGHNFRTAYQGKSIGSRSFKADNGFGGMFGDDDNGDSDNGNFNQDSLFHHNSRGSHSDYDNGGDYDDNGDGLSGHHVKIPIIT